MSYLNPSSGGAIPLSIDGVDVILPSGERTRSISTDKTPSFTAFQGATSEVAAQAVETGAVVLQWFFTPGQRRAQ